MTIKAVLFDLGGTLLHYHDKETDDMQRHFRRITLEGVQALADNLREHGYDLPPDDQLQESVDRLIAESYRRHVAELVSESIEGPLRKALTEAGITPQDADWQEARRQFYREIDRIVWLREGAAETLDMLREQGYKLGLISNTYWAGDLHDRHLKEYGLLKFLPVRVYSCDEPRIKPHPSVFETALARMGVRAEESVYVGDRLDADVAGAQGAGMLGILIRSPYQTKEMGDVQPDAIIDELPDLIPALKMFQAGATIP